MLALDLRTCSTWVHPLYWTIYLSRDMGGVPPPAEDDAQSEAAEWERRERRIREEERRQEAEGLGAEEDEERLLFLALPPLHGLCRRRSD